MTLPSQKTVPSEFIRLDTNVSAADRFVNVRDLQVVRDNHNMIIGRQLRRVIATDYVREASNRYKPLNRSNSTPVYYMPIGHLAYGRKSLRVDIEANKLNAEDDNPVLYFAVDSSDYKYPDELTGATTVTVTSTSATIT